MGERAAIEVEKRDLLRQSYIQMLLNSGVRGEELERALEAIARVDQRLFWEADVQAGTADLERRTEAHFRAWAEAEGLDYEALSEEDLMALVQRGVKAIRRELWSGLGSRSAC